MDYVVGSVAALISGNVTPNRPKVLKRALTPMKHQPSPNVTPKSESITDRSIFLSPTMQKKKAIVKKSPKRIFENPDLDATNDNDGFSSISSPKADKVKKHLKDELDVDITSPKSPKNKINKPVASPSKTKQNVSAVDSVGDEIKASNESTPKKKKKNDDLVSNSDTNNESILNNCNNNQNINSNIEIGTSVEKCVSKKKKKSNVLIETINRSETQVVEAVNDLSSEKSHKGSKKVKNKSSKVTKVIGEVNNSKIDKNPSLNNENQGQIKKNKKHKKNELKNVVTKLGQRVEYNASNRKEEAQYAEGEKTGYINPNAITNQDTDSEHESDDEIQSENEESNKAVLDTGPESSDDEEETEKNVKNTNKEDKKAHVVTEEEVKRTLFVGNVPFSSKCKKEMKRLFSKYGEIETVRIRTVPVKDGSMTPKLAVIKNELHPERSTVNVYIKYVHPSSVDDALVENNSVHKEHHLRVARSNVTGSEHDPRCSVFVGNIPFALEDEGLRDKFKMCGQIESVRIIRDKKTNAGKGFGYVNFKSKDSVELALALTEEDLTIKNRILRVKRCTQPSTKQLGREHNKQARQQNYQGRPQPQGKHFINHRGGNSRDTQMNRFGRNKFSNDRFQRRDQTADGKSEGAYRRIMNKRKQEGGEGPPQKRQKDLNQPQKEKKPRKEFVGVTADKKKFQKRKLNKDQKKKKTLSEILTKQRQ